MAIWKLLHQTGTSDCFPHSPLSSYSPLVLIHPSFPLLFSPTLVRCAIFDFVRAPPELPKEDLVHVVDKPMANLYEATDQNSGEVFAYSTPLTSFLLSSRYLFTPIHPRLLLVLSLLLVSLVFAPPILRRIPLVLSSLFVCVVIADLIHRRIPLLVLLPPVRSVLVAPTHRCLSLLFSLTLRVRLGLLTLIHPCIPLFFSLPLVGFLIATSPDLTTPCSGTFAAGCSMCDLLFLPCRCFLFLRFLLVEGAVTVLETESYPSTPVSAPEWSLRSQWGSLPCPRSRGRTVVGSTSNSGSTNPDSNEQSSLGGFVKLGLFGDGVPPSST